MGPFQILWAWALESTRHIKPHQWNLRTRSSPQWCAQSVVADLRPFGLGYLWGRGWAQSTTRPLIPISSLLTHILNLLQFLSYLAGSKNVSAGPPVRPGYDDKYRSRSYIVVERQKFKFKKKLQGTNLLSKSTFLSKLKTHLFRRSYPGSSKSASVITSSISNPSYLASPWPSD